MSILSIQAREGYRSDPAQYRRSVSVNIVVNTVCNRRCPHCCYGGIVRSSEQKHFSPEAIAEEVRCVEGTPAVYLLGGEATLHPQFGELLQQARAARGAGRLVLVTNGARLAEQQEYLQYVDGVQVTVDDSGHVNYGGGVNPCFRIHCTVGVREGRMYPCCVACGVVEAASTDLSPGWESRILLVEAPCERCVFGA